MESEQVVVQRARNAHKRLEKAEHDRIWWAAASHPSLRNCKEDPVMLLRWDLCASDKCTQMQANPPLLLCMFLDYLVSEALYLLLLLLILLLLRRLSLAEPLASTFRTS